VALYTVVQQGPGATAAAVANAVALSDLTLPQHARMITRIWVTAAPVGTFAASKPLVGYVQVTSDDCGIKPLEIPIEPVGGYLTLGVGRAAPATKWVVNCPCPGGTELSFDVVADVAPNAAPEVQVVVEFSDGGSPFPGGQMHMEMAEPAVAQSTSDNGETSLTDLEIKASKLHMWVGYVSYTTLVADTSCVATVSVESDDFSPAGPNKFSINPSIGGDANLAGSLMDLTKIEMDRTFRVPAQKQTVSCKVTMRDAVSTAPLANWGLVYSK